MKWLIALLACIGLAQAQVIQHNISDDGYARVPLQFPFPYYGRVFTDSYMFSNGVIGFGSVQQSWCCSGFDLTQQQGYHLNYAIMPLQTDLINYGQGRFLTEGTTTYQRYKWENISEYGRPNNLNTFGVEIRPNGFIGMYYDQVKVDSHVVTIGMTGDTALGEYTQHYYGYGINRTNFSYTTDATGNMCPSNPLSSPTCPGYQDALILQYCSIDSLYSPQCPNYQQAYLAQQCSINPLYDTTCPSYAQSYHNQQCSLNPLYATTCQGYAQAYFNEQCRLNPLYDRTCTGYAEAYALANVIPATSTQTVSTTVPSVQVSVMGTVTLETPVVADPVVNNVITSTAPTATSTVTRQTAPSPVTQPAQTSEKKEEKKEERKEERKEVKQVSVSTGKPVETPIGTVATIKSPEMPQGFDIIDYSHKKLIANLPTIKENRRILWMMNDSDKRHKEMVDGQWSR